MQLPDMGAGLTALLMQPCVTFKARQVLSVSPGTLTLRAFGLLGEGQHLRVPRGGKTQEERQMPQELQQFQPPAVGLFQAPAADHV